MADQLSRRKVFGVLTAGAVGVAGSRLQAGMPRAADHLSPVADIPLETLQATRRAAHTLGRSIERRASFSGQATVAHCRSWDTSVYLYIDESTRGFVQVSDGGFAIAATCQAMGRPVAVRCWGHDAGWGDGVGRFEGCLLALDARDLPPLDGGSPTF